MNTIEILVDFTGILLRRINFGDGGLMVPEAFTSNANVLNLATEIRKMYQSQFINNKYEFSYIGFQKDEEEEYLALVYTFYQSFKKEMDGKYNVELKTDILQKYQEILNYRTKFS